MTRVGAEGEQSQEVTADMSWVDGPDSPVHRLPEPERSQFRDAEFETLRFPISAGDRKWVDHPSGNGFFTLNRSHDYSVLVVTSYSIHPEDLGNRDALVGLLSDWQTSSRPRHTEPVQIGFSKQWSQTVPAGSTIVVEALRGQTPVSMFFQAA